MKACTPSEEVKMIKFWLCWLQWVHINQVENLHMHSITEAALERSPVKSRTWSSWSAGFHYCYIFHIFRNQTLMTLDCLDIKSFMLILCKFSNISTFPEQKHTSTKQTNKELFNIIIALCELPIKKRENILGAPMTDSLLFWVFLKLTDLRTLH